MQPTTPYLIRGIYEWCADQGFTPHLLVDASVEGVVVPGHLVENDTIVLNIQSTAVRELDLGNEWILFNARFSGKPMDINVPISAVRAIFAKENGQGCAFESAVELTPEEVADAMEELGELEKKAKHPSSEKGKISKIKPKSSKKSHLKLVD